MWLRALRQELMVFGIDVVIIEPGTVNTAIYNKGEKEDLSEFKPTEYWETVRNFQKYIVNEARTNGLSPKRLGEAVHVALTTAKPKARYAVVPQRFKNWTWKLDEKRLSGNATGDFQVDFAD